MPPECPALYTPVCHVTVSVGAVEAQLSFSMTGQLSRLQSLRLKFSEHSLETCLSVSEPLREPGQRPGSDSPGWYRLSGNWTLWDLSSQLGYSSDPDPVVCWGGGSHGCLPCPDPLPQAGFVLPRSPAPCPAHSRLGPHLTPFFLLRVGLPFSTQAVTAFPVSDSLPPRSVSVSPSSSLSLEPLPQV